MLDGETGSHRDWALYGWWGSTINVTDGTYTYMHPCVPDEPAYCYATSQLNPWGWMGPKTPKTDAESGQFLPYTDTPVWRFAAPPDPAHEEPLLFDVDSDPRQTENLAPTAPDELERMQSLLLDAMGELEPPAQQYTRFGLDARSHPERDD